jgi:hypothetical protein
MVAGQGDRERQADIAQPDDGDALVLHDRS